MSTMYLGGVQQVNLILPLTVRPIIVNYIHMEHIVCRVQLTWVSI